MKQTIEQKAKEIIRSEKTKEAEISKIMDAETSKNLELLLKEFEIGFSLELEILKNSGITYSAHYQNNKYPHQRSFILFKRGDKSVKMDFANRSSYRYEFVPYESNYGTMVYGDWDKQRFIKFLYENLY